MLRKIGALAGALAIVMVPVTMAQHPKPSPRVTHATIGTINQVDELHRMIVITPIVGAEQSYAFGKQTVVHGLPGSKGMTALTGKLGDKVVLHYATVAEKLEAVTVEYLGAVEIQQAAGTVTNVDAKARSFTLQPQTGAAEHFVFAPRAAVELKGGIVTFGGFARLTNVVATVFYTLRGNEKLVWYLQEAAPPAVSVR